MWVLFEECVQAIVFDECETMVSIAFDGSSFWRICPFQIFLLMTGFLCQKGSMAILGQQNQNRAPRKLIPFLTAAVLIFLKNQRPLL